MHNFNHKNKTGTKKFKERTNVKTLTVTIEKVNNLDFFYKHLYQTSVFDHLFDHLYQTSVSFHLFDHLYQPSVFDHLFH